MRFTIRWKKINFGFSNILMAFVFVSSHVWIAFTKKYVKTKLKYMHFLYVWKENWNVIFFTYINSSFNFIKYSKWKKFPNAISKNNMRKCTFTPYPFKIFQLINNRCNFYKNRRPLFKTHLLVGLPNLFYVLSIESKYYQYHLWHFILKWFSP